MLGTEVLYLSPESEGGGAAGTTVKSDDSADAVQKVSLEGKEYTIGEIKSMIMFQSDYTRKTKELAEKTRNIEDAFEGVKALATITQLADTDPQGAIEQFKRLIAREERAHEGEGKQSAEIDRLKSQLEEFRSDVMLREMIVDTRADPKIGKIFTEYQDDIEDYALKHQIGNLRVATIAWEEDNPEKIKVVKKPDLGLQADAGIEKRGAGVGNDGKGYSLSERHVRSGNINAALEEWRKKQMT